MFLLAGLFAAARLFLEQMISEKIQEKYDALTLEEKKEIHKLFLDSDKFSQRYNELANVIYKKIPPSPEEFLDPENGWLSKSYAESIREWVGEDFLNIVNGSKEFSIVSMYGATRLGKSYLAMLLIHYTIVFFHHLRDPNLYYNMAPTTSLCIYILSFDFKKVHEVYLKPLYNLLESNDKFVQVKFQDQVKKEQKKYGVDKIVWSKASLIGHLTLASGLQIVSGNDDALKIIGSNILSAFVSEIAFFIESNGASEENIFRIYSDVTERIKATVGRTAKLSFTYLDSSANNSESKIEKHILKDLSKRKDVYFRRRRRWDVVELHDTYFPEWKKTGETFLVCTGDGSYPAKILYKKEASQVKDIPKELLIQVPIDSLVEFETNLIKSIKDIAGVPTTSESKLISDGQLIEAIFDNNYLKNEEAVITVDSREIPDGFIWDKIKNKYFLRTSDKDYLIKRAQREPRWIGIDLAFAVKGDLAGISMGHKEYDRKYRDTVYVTDFAFAIGPGENGINLEAISDFIICLVYYGKVKIRGVYVDTFQSENLRQQLDRNLIPLEKQSVDRTLEPYLFLLSTIINYQLKAGPNIILKNNLKSLYRTRNSNNHEKIDHSIGITNNIYYGDWENSDAGINAKDVSDAVAHWVYGSHNDDWYATTCYEDENDKLKILQDMKKKSQRETALAGIEQGIFDQLHKGY